MILFRLAGYVEFSHNIFAFLCNLKNKIHSICEISIITRNQKRVYFM